MNIKSQKDFFCGLMFIAVGVAFAVGASTYRLGSAARMGPGYFPVMLGILLAIIGVMVVFQALVIETKDGDKIGKWAWKPLFYIISANFVFGVLLTGLPSINLPGFGMIIGIYALIFIASMAQAGWKFITTFILATVLTVGSYVTFILVMKLQVPLWPTFIVTR